MKEEIFSLYDTILGHFTFFRKFIKILYNIAEIMEADDILKKLQDGKINTVKKELEEELTKTKEEIEELKERVDSLHTLPPNEGKNFTSRPAEIMDKYFETYNKTKE